MFFPSREVTKQMKRIVKQAITREKHCRKTGFFFPVHHWDPSWGLGEKFWVDVANPADGTVFDCQGTAGSEDCTENRLKV